MNDLDHPDWLNEVRQVLDLDHAVRWMAALHLLADGETNLSTGKDEDYAIFFPTGQGPATLIPHDLDFHSGLRGNYLISDLPLPLFDMAEPGTTGLYYPQLAALFSIPEVAHQYYLALDDLMQTSFSADVHAAVVEKLWRGWASDSRIERTLDFLEEHKRHIRAAISRPLEVTSGPIEVNGLPRVVAGETIALEGTYPGLRVISVKVNGVPADLNPMETSWELSLNTGDLNPGQNQILIEGLGETGEVVETSHYSLQVAPSVGPDPGGQVVGGTVTGTETFSASGGPYQITTDLIFEGPEAHLVIEPGASLFFGRNVRLYVRNGARLTAVGTATDRIVLTRDPAASGDWNGLVIHNTEADNRIRFADFSITDVDYAVRVTKSRVSFEDVRWLGDGIAIAAGEPKISLVRCEFEEMTHSFPVIEVVNLTGDSFLTMTDCLFAPCETGVRCDGLGPAGTTPLTIERSRFLESRSEALSLSRLKARIDHCFFGGTTTAAAIRAGQQSEMIVTRSVVADCGIAFHLTDGGAGEFSHNTVVRTATGIRTEGPGSPAHSVSAHHNLFARVPTPFEHSPATGLFLANTLSSEGPFPPSVQFTDGGGVKMAPVHLEESDGVEIRDGFDLVPESPGIAAGRNGLNLGALVSLAKVGMGPPPRTSETSTTLLIAGAGTHYRYRLNGGAFSAEFPITQPITLTSLASGTHRVEVEGRFEGGPWEPAASPFEWTIDSSTSPIVLNEICALNGGSIP
ncbi:MAG: CotH kinase family protein, partial [Verrucomicrobiota bacterium]